MRDRISGFFNTISRVSPAVLGGLIIFIGLLHALIYALVMPPWGLLDESQHFHYVQYLVEEHRLPVLWSDHLSDEVIDSIFATRRYVTLGNETMPVRAEVMIPGRLDFESYEAYQPPLYYLFLVPFYVLGPAPILSKLFFLRLAGVLFSGFTLLIIWRSSRLLFPGQVWIAVAATLFTALLPERAISVAQLNNDILLEVFCAAVFGLLAAMTVQGFTRRNILLTGFMLGLAILTKLSALTLVPIVIFAWGIIAFHRQQPWQSTLKQILAILGIVALCACPLFVRNIVLYGDLMGINTFLAQTDDLVKGTLFQRLEMGLLDLFRNSWIILWDGMAVVTKPSATLLYVLLAVTTLFIILTLFTAWLRKDKLLSQNVVEISVPAITLVSVSVLVSYIQGLFPTVQGRFLLPVMVPTAWLIGSGLWLMGERWRGLVATALLSLETILGMSVLFFHSLPKYYAPRHSPFLGYWPQTVYLFSSRGLFWDKPDFITLPGLLSVLSIFILVGLIITGWGMASFGFPVRPGDIFRFFTGVLQTIRKLSPDTSPQPTATSNQPDLMTRFKRIGCDPLLWIGLILFIFYWGWTFFYPPEVFWSLDEGGKFIHLQSIIQSGNVDGTIIYPGRFLDTKFEFIPLYFWSQTGDKIYSWWPLAFPVISIPFYLLFGSAGLYLVPALFGALTCVLSGLIARSINPDKPWLPVGAAVLTGLTTPVTFYSTTFWEHTFSTALLVGGIGLILLAWKKRNSYFIVIAGLLFSCSTYFRTDTFILVGGILIVFLLIRWRWSLVLTASYFVSSLPWLIANKVLVGHIFSRQWAPGTVSFSNNVWFSGIKEAGWRFIPYTLFNAPKIGAFDLSDAVLIIATLSTIAVIILPFFKKSDFLLAVSYGIVIAISGWVLWQPEGYRSVHGFLLIAPHCIFAARFFSNSANFRKTLFPLVFLGMSGLYGLAYLMKGWVASGGLQWGPRYWLVFYPILVILSLLAFAQKPFQEQKALWILYGLAIWVGVGFEVRGIQSAFETRQYYNQTRQAVMKLDADAVVTDCPWLSMIAPDIYFTGKIFSSQNNDHLNSWMKAAGVNSFCYIQMDLCALTPLDEIATLRALEPAGLNIVCTPVKD